MSLDFNQSLMYRQNLVNFEVSNFMELRLTVLELLPSRHCVMGMDREHFLLLFLWRMRQKYIAYSVCKCHSLFRESEVPRVTVSEVCAS
jgi:hypothetical protein